MADFVDLVQCMKKTAVESIEANKPCNVYFGTVTSIEPLKITVEQKLTLEDKQLILTRNVTEHQIRMTTVGNNGIGVSHWTETEGSHSHGLPVGNTTSTIAHNHAYTGTKIFTVHNGLVIDDKVILLRIQGGQKYVVIDRIG